MVQEGHFEIPGALTPQFSITGLTYYSSLEEGEKWNSLFFFKYKTEANDSEASKESSFFPWGSTLLIFKDKIHSRAGLHKTG